MPLPKVFISYSHDSPAHAAKVLALTQRLRGDGVAVALDQDEKFPTVGWPQWSEDRVRDAKFVLLVCTETYCRRWDGVENPGVGHGAAHECQLIKQILYDAKGVNERFVPVLLGVEDALHVPLALRRYARFRLDAEYEKLRLLITNQREKELRYLARLIEEIEAKAQLYSPLHAIGQRNAWDGLRRPWRNDPDLALLRHSPRRRADVPEQQRDYDDILAAFANVRRAALLGAPGAGKSTTLRKLALDLARRAQKDQDAPLPILAPLGNWSGDEPLADFLASTAPEISFTGKRLVLLLDGLNEVPTAKRAAKAAEVLKLQDGLDRATAIVVSCRREDYAGDLDLGLDTLTLEPLSPQRIRVAVRLWVALGGETVETADRFFWQLAGDVLLAGLLEKWKSAGAEEDAFWTISDPKEHKAVFEKTSGPDDELWRKHIPNPRSLMRLASNPFMLTMLYQVWVMEKGVLPQNRGDLFGQFINCLLSREKLLVVDDATGEWRRKPEGERLLAGLADLAWRMQSDRIGTGKQESGDFGVLTVASRSTALEALGDESLLKKALDATLLEGDGELRFRHQLLQEYFTAKALEARFAQTDPAELWSPDRWWERSGWEETAVLLAGFYSEDCSHVIRWLARAQPEVAVQCILESGAEIADRPRLLAELQGAWLQRLGEPQPEARAAAGRALGRLDLDTRRGVGLTTDGVPDIDWVEIPGGEFIYQENERRKVDRFLIARYPVTNAQYQGFLDAEDGYRQDRWWKGLSDPGRQPGISAWSESNHPRETVSWYEAMAFCAWLGSKLGREVSLPTEWQWERAARGTDGRAYPWGNEYIGGYANINEYESGPHNLGRTSLTFAVRPKNHQKTGPSIR